MNRYTPRDAVTPAKCYTRNSPCNGDCAPPSENLVPTRELGVLHPVTATVTPPSPDQRYVTPPPLGGVTVTPGREAKSVQALLLRSTNGSLPATLVDDLGRILGEALMLQFQRDAAAMVNSPGEPNHAV